MSNTGKKIVLTLKQVNSITFAPTGLTEVNDLSNPDYIPPYNDFITCPISHSLSCPLSIFTGATGSFGFEFSLFNSVVENPSVAFVQVVAVSNSIGINNTTFTLPNSTPNYFSGSVNVGHGVYTTQIIYRDSGNNPIGSCTYTSSIFVG